MNKKNLILGLVVIVIIVFAIYIYFEIPKKESSVSLNFSYEPTNQAFHCGYNFSRIREVNWIGENILELNVQDNINCAQKIGKGDYKIEKNKIILYYELIGNPDANCVFCTNMTYKFTGLEKKDYEFELHSK